MNAAVTLLSLALILSAALAAVIAQPLADRERTFVWSASILFTVLAIVAPAIDVSGPVGLAAQAIAQCESVAAPAVLCFALPGLLGTRLPDRMSALGILLAVLFAIVGTATRTTLFLSAPPVVFLIALSMVAIRRFPLARLASLEVIAASICFLSATAVQLHGQATVALLVFSIAGLLGASSAIARLSEFAVEQKTRRSETSRAVDAGGAGAGL